MLPAKGTGPFWQAKLMCRATKAKGRFQQDGSSQLDVIYTINARSVQWLLGESALLENGFGKKRILYVLCPRSGQLCLWHALSPLLVTFSTCY